jgi:hypothetical protein
MGRYRLAGLLSVAVLLLGLTACSRPSQESCEEACSRLRTFAKQDFDRITEAIPEERQREGWVQAAPVLEEMRKGCVAACLEGGTSELVACLNGAPNATAWRACIAERP